MVINLRYKGLYDVGVSNGKFMIKDGEKTSIKEVPFLRFQLDNYGKEEITFIKAQMNKFKYSVPICEVNLSDNTLATVCYIKDTLQNAAIFVYIPIDDEDVKDGKIADDKEKQLGSLLGIDVDRLILLDNSDTLNLVVYNNIRIAIAKKLNRTLSDIGICKSPFSFDTKDCCLCAEYARKLISIYGVEEGGKIPSANHQDMVTECSCIRHIDIIENIEAPVDKKVRGKVKDKKKDDKGSKKVKKVRNNIPMEWI